MKNLIKLTLLILIIIVSYENTKNNHQKQVSVVFVKNTSSKMEQQNREIRGHDTRKENETKSKEPYLAITLPIQDTIANKIRRVFKEEPEKAVAVFRSESGLKATAQGWNCYYNDDNGEVYSTSCRVEDREKAWSVDCGIAQLNFKGKECPAESFDPDWNIQKAYEWKYLSNKKAGGTGWGPWVAEAKGRYLAFLKSK